MKIKIFSITLLYTLILSFNTAQGSTLLPSSYKSISAHKTAVLQLKNSQLLEMSPCTDMQSLTAEAGVLKKAFPEIDISYCLKNYSWAHARILTEEGAVIVSTVLYYRETNNETFISKIAVHPDHQGKGIGQAFILYLAALTQCESIGLCSKTSALDFYKKIGFIHRTPKDTIELVKHFSPPLSLATPDSIEDSKTP